MSNTKSIAVGKNEYVVKAVPIAKIGRAFSSLVKPIKELVDSSDKDDLDAETVVGELAVQAGSQLENFIRIFIPTLPAGFLDDEENGPTLPELINILVAIYRVNRMDSINSFFRGLIPKDAVTQAISYLQKKGSQSTKSLSSAPKPTDGDQAKPEA
jgi:hypothetical protein